jgi:hypothetical protein
MQGSYHCDKPFSWPMTKFFCGYSFSGVWIRNFEKGEQKLDAFVYRGSIAGRALKPYL